MVLMINRPMYIILMVHKRHSFYAIKDSFSFYVERVESPSVLLELKHQEKTFCHMPWLLVMPLLTDAINRQNTEEKMGNVIIIFRCGFLLV